MKEGLAYASLSFYMVLPFQYMQILCQRIQNRQEIFKVFVEVIPLNLFSMA